MKLSRRSTQHVEVTVITGLSGAGRSEVAKALEDLEWFVIDNLPPALITKMLSLALAPGNDINRIALVIDARGGVFFAEAAEALEKVRRDVSNFRLVFLEASDDALVRRFDASRRLHPLATDAHVQVGIQRERELLSPFRDGADLILDTSDLSVRELRTKISAYFESGVPAEGLKTTIISFGYKFGLPLDADIVLDVRFLPNPHWVDELRPLTGLDAAVRDYVLDREPTMEFLARARDLLAVLLPGYQGEGRHYLTVAIGCTGGRHRSVVLAQEIGALMEEKGFRAKVIHRDVERPPVIP
ncbi:MAG: RNase adapter protein RapZ [Actinomycetota bacterium]|nr:RNase adapter protein RapZ [Actinomycetota bacterium]